MAEDAACQSPPSGVQEQLAALRQELAATQEQLAGAQQRLGALHHELTHRVKNNFQLVGSLLRLQARRAGNDVAARILNTTVLRIQGMSALHESLYRNRDIGRVELSRYIQDVCGRLAEALVDGRDIRVAVEAEPVELPGEYALPLGLAISELVSNALRHAFADGRAGEVVITFRQEAQDFVLAVRDTGRGIEDRASVLDRGFGLLLVRSCAQQVEGELEVAEGPTTFSIRFPVAIAAV